MLLMDRRRLILAAASAAALASGAGKALAQQAKLKVGTLKQAGLTDVWVAKQAGIFERNGLDVELVEFRNGNEAIAAHQGGYVDIMLSIPGSAMTAIEQGFDLVLISQNETAKATAPDAGAIQVLAD